MNNYSHMEGNTAVIHDEMNVFCHLVVEEFLMGNKMHTTLNAFRKEWDRPNNTIAIPSWYNVALKLQMPELISKDNKTTTVLENMIHALTKESSIRSRRPIEVIAHALTMPKNTILPDISDPQGPFPVDTLRQTQSADSRKERKKPATPGPAIISGPPHQDTTFAAAMHRGNKNSARASVKLDQVMQRLIGDTTNLIPSKLLPAEVIDKYAPAKQNKTSMENWIPDNVRLNQSMRSLKVAHQNIDDAIMLELDLKRTLKGVNVTPYDQAVKEEELGVTKKTKCACCLQQFLYVNLPLKVSEKAIIDIRVKWTGGMTSQTVWSDTLKAIVADSFEVPSSSSIIPEIETSIVPETWTKPHGKMVSKKKVPEITPIKVYSDVKVCLFCSQFFHVQEKYRPSFADMVKEEKRVARQERKAREAEYWDPNKMVEKDRDIDDKARSLALKKATAGQETRIITSGGNDE